ncbi:MAG: hypothetical protein OXH83_15580, partial [Bryobacterales bacterium]|nr:hypothetical protein [Bryobacterales bacterium]
GQTRCLNSGHTQLLGISLLTAYEQLKWTLGIGAPDTVFWHELYNLSASSMMAIIGRGGLSEIRSQGFPA